MVEVLTIGETLGVVVTGPDQPLLTSSQARLSIAGAEATVAIGLSRLGVDVAWVGTVGADSWGSRVCREIHAEGVDTAHVQRDPIRATGLMVRELRAPALTRVTYYRADSAGSRLTAEQVELAITSARPKLVHLTGITAAISECASEAFGQAIRSAHAVGAAVSLDVNYRATLSGAAAAAEQVRAVLPWIDVLFVGDDELHVVLDEPLDDPLRQLQELGVAEVVVKRGSAGAEALDGFDRAVAPSHVVPVVDVIGAGDSFVAGYLAARTFGLPLASRLRWGTTCAAFTVASSGDWEGLPSRLELDAFDGQSRTVR